MSAASPVRERAAVGLKILHVGNIAQNGYINASILRARGHDCDLIAPDLLHAGSSPEWYELSAAEVDVARLGDSASFPDFYALGGAMPQIGAWVAQGPFLPALLTLLLQRRDDPRAHTALSALNYLRFKMTLQRSTDPFAVPLAKDAFEDELGRRDIPPALRRRLLLGRMAEEQWNWIRDRVLLQEDTPYVRGWRPPVSVGTLEPYFARDPILEGVVRGLRSNGLAQSLFIEFAGPLMDYGAAIRGGFTPEEVVPYCWVGRVLRDLVSHYDIAIFYGDACKFAFASGIEEYWALEHGTIRILPFEPTVNARLLRAGFLHATRVLLTNTDYATAAPRLEFTPEQRVYLPHPFDEAPALAFSSTHVVRRGSARVVFFCPARQEWASGHPDMVKGNDLYFRAGRFLLDRGRSDFLFHCINWGIDRDASRALITDLGLDDYVRWSPMLPKRALWGAMMDGHAVIDQFHLSAMGGVTFETLALGRRLISRDDGINNAVFFDQPPPILPAADAEEIAARMLAVMDDPEDRAGWGDRGASWIAQHHSADRICELQMVAWGEISGKRGASERVADPRAETPAGHKVALV